MDNSIFDIILQNVQTYDMLTLAKPPINSDKLIMGVSWNLSKRNKKA